LTRLIFWALIGWLLVVGLRKLVAGGAAGTRAATPPASEDMVRCVSCGLNLPKSEAVPMEGAWACCAAHARRPAAQP